MEQSNPIMTFQLKRKARGWIKYLDKRSDFTDYYVPALFETSPAIVKKYLTWCDNLEKDNLCVNYYFHKFQTEIGNGLTIIAEFREKGRKVEYIFDATDYESW